MTSSQIELITQALRFSFWGAAEGLAPCKEDGVEGPEDFFFEYSLRSGDEDWETIAERFSLMLRSEELD